MIRIKNHESRIKVFLFFLVLFIIHNSLFIIHVDAADSTPSADIKNKLEQLKQEIASKASALKKEITQKLQNKAFSGVVKSKSDQSITLATKAGIKIAGVNEDTIYQDDTKKRKKFSLETITEEDSIAALGDVDDTGVLIARKIVLLLPPSSKYQPKTIVWGQVLSVSEKLVTIRDKDSKNITLSTDKETILQKNKKEVSLKDLEGGDYLIATGVFDEDTSKVGTLNTGFVYILTPVSQVKPIEATKSASPSASLKPTSKPTAIPKPKATPKTS